MAERATPTVPSMVVRLLVVWAAMLALVGEADAAVDLPPSKPRLDKLRPTDLASAPAERTLTDRTSAELAAELAAPLGSAAAADLVGITSAEDTPHDAAIASVLDSLGGAQPVWSDGAQPAVSDGAQPAVSDGAQPVVSDGASSSKLSSSKLSSTTLAAETTQSAEIEPSSAAAEAAAVCVTAGVSAEASSATALDAALLQVRTLRAEAKSAIEEKRWSHAAALYEEACEVNTPPPLPCLTPPHLPMPNPPPLPPTA